MDGGCSHAVALALSGAGGSTDPTDKTKRTSMETIIKFNLEDLTANGRHLLAAATSRSRHLATLLRPRDGVIHADIAGDADSDDVVRVVVQDTLSYADRARRFGVEGLDAPNVLRDADGQPVRASSGDYYVPTEKYIADVERVYGDSLNSLASRLWEVPDELVARVRSGELPGAAAWNAIADAFVAWCDEGAFEVVISPDWLTMTAVAAEFGVTNAAVRNAAGRGSLATWEDWREPNPQKRTRVSRADAARLWVKAAESVE